MTLDHVVGLYNYWIVIFLMMTGFYIVISSKNLIKAVIGLNVFQTSVFLLYITMGKIYGGTAPIIPPALTDTHAAEAHAPAGHGEAGHGEAGHGETGHGEPAHGVTAHPSPAHPEPGHTTDGHPTSGDTTAGDTTAGHHEPGHGDAAEGLATGHDEQPGELVEALLSDLIERPDELTSETIVYSHPLPSVLMLTAIVVGIATTALALALIVRIREEYGTIEEDEILALDRKA